MLILHLLNNLHFPQQIPCQVPKYSVSFAMYDPQVRDSQHIGIIYKMLNQADHFFSPLYLLYLNWGKNLPFFDGVKSNRTWPFSPSSLAVFETFSILSKLDFGFQLANTYFSIFSLNGYDLCQGTIIL
jgi:hypothetical protein